MHRYVVDLHIPTAELLRYYRGKANAVVVLARSGERVRFPADALRKYVDREGIRGTFSLSVDGANRLRGIERLG